MAVALEGEDVGREAVEEHAVMADNDGAAGEILQRVFQRAQRLGVEIVGRFVEEQDVAALLEKLGQMDAVALAARQGADLLPLVAALAALLRQAGFTTHLVEHVDSLVWGKLAVNAGINPLTALLNVPNGYLAQDPRARRIMMAAAAETAAVAAAQGIPLPYASAPQRALAVAQATAANHSSMLQDVRQGRPTEIEAICGAIARVGQQWSVPTPVNTALWRLVKALENSKIDGLSHIA